MGSKDGYALQLPLELLERGIVIPAVNGQALKVVNGRNGRGRGLFVRRDVISRVLDSDVAHFCRV